MASVKVHEGYSRFGPPSVRLKNDIALVRLARAAAVTGDSVRPVCLPAEAAEVALRLGVGDLGDASLRGRSATLAGWGKVSPGDAGNLTKTGASSNVLRAVQVPITPTQRCDENFRGSGVRISEDTQVGRSGATRDIPYATLPLSYCPSL